MLRRILACVCTLALGAGAQNVSAKVMAAAIDLVDAGHILHFLDVVDAFGHVSVRNPDNASEFLMSFSLAPALATSQSIVTYEIDNATSVQLTFNSSVTGAAVPSGFLERYIHSQIYKAFPTVQGVVHAHTQEVLPFGNAEVPLTAQMTTGGSLGTQGTPIFDVNKLPTSILPSNQLHDLLIRDEALGDALAKAFIPSCQVILMKGHGMAVKGAGVRDAVFRAYYTKQNAINQLQGILLGGGKQPQGLTAREAVDSANTTEGANLLGRAWTLWAKQVDQAGLYINDLRNGSAPSPTGT